MKTNRAAEAHIYWCAATSARQAKRYGKDYKPELEELVAISLHTDWIKLKARCAGTIVALYEPQEGSCESSA